jgi:hypothetical protein
MGKVPAVNRDHYIIYLEVFNDMYWLHTDVFKWTAEIKKSFIIDLDVLQDLGDSPLFGLVEQDNSKLGKFGESIGFSYLQDLKGNDGNTYKIYKRSI